MGNITITAAKKHTDGLKEWTPELKKMARDLTKAISNIEQFRDLVFYEGDDEKMKKFSAAYKKLCINFSKRRYIKWVFNS